MAKYWLWASGVLLSGLGWSTLSADVGNAYEQRLVQTLERVQQAQLETALEDVEGLLSQYRNSRLGNLIYADLLMAITGAIDDFGGPAAVVPHAKTIQALREEALTRWKHQRGGVLAYHGLVPANLLDLGDNRYVAFFDVGEARLYLYENRDGVPHLVRDYYMTIGLNGAGKVKEGDQRTPIGVYHVTTFLPDSELPDRYGVGAFPIDYPNAMDRRRKRTGHGIWLHGTASDTFNRVPKDSDGCMVVSNADFNTLHDFIDPKERTPVVLAEQVEWVSPAELVKRKQAVMQVLENWRRDWESLNTERYLSHYSKTEFRGFGKDFDSWAAHKRQVNTNKTFIQVRLGVRGIYVYPGEPDTVLVELDQRYLSDNFQGRSQKQQYWKQDPSGRWRIVYEGRG